MEGILPEPGTRDKNLIREQSRHCQDAALKMRYLIIVDLMNGQTVAVTVSALQVGRSTVYAVAKRFREDGEAGLVDRRKENGKRKLDDDYLTRLNDIVAGAPQDYGWRRPTGTRETLTKTMTQQTRVRIHVSTMSRALQNIGARLGRPKPIVGCPWPERHKHQRLQAIQEIVVDQLPADEVAVYEDDVDIHLNPKIGPDWMTRGQQKEAMTPSKNEKGYLAGAVDSRTNEFICVEGEKKQPAVHSVAVGTALSGGPPHRSVRAELPHTAPTSGVWRRNVHWGRGAGCVGAGSSGQRVGENGSTASDDAGCDVEAQITRRESPHAGSIPALRSCLVWRGSCSNHARRSVAMLQSQGLGDGGGAAVGLGVPGSSFEAVFS